MTFDNTLPADNRRWDLAAGDIRNNNDALEVVLGVDLDTSTVDLSVLSLTAGSADISGSVTAGDISTDDLITKSPWFDIRAYGATVSETPANNTIAIQAAIDAAELVNGTVFIPPGTFQFTNLVISTSMKMTGAGQVFRWRGASTSILEHTGAGDAITMDNATSTHVGSITLSNFELIPSVSGAGANGISIINSSTGSIRGVLLDNLSIRNFGVSCIIGSGTVFDITLNRVFTMTSTDDCIRVLTGGGQPSQWRFIDCYSISETGVWCYDINSEQSYFGSGTISGNGNGIRHNGSVKVTGMNMEGTEVVGSVGFNFIGNLCIIDGTNIFKWDVGVRIGPLSGTDVARGFDFTGDLTGNMTFDIQLTDGASRKYAYVKNLGVAQAVPIPIVDNQREDTAEAFGELFVWVDGNMPIGRVTPISYLIPTLESSATPSVLGSDKWLPRAGVATISNFADGVQGQTITILSDRSVTITDGTNIFLSGSVDFLMTDTDSLTLTQRVDGKWYEDARGDNGV